MVPLEVIPVVGSSEVPGLDPGTPHARPRMLAMARLSRSTAG